jgi:hypothetical protein
MKFKIGRYVLTLLAVFGVYYLGVAQTPPATAEQGWGELFGEQEAKEAEDTTVTLDFATRLAQAKETMPYSAKIEAFKDLIKQVGQKPENKTMFLAELENLVNQRKPEQISKLTELLYQIAYNPAFKDVQSQVELLTSKATMPVTYTEKINNLKTEIGQASINMKKKMALQKRQKELFADLRTLVLDRDGKSEMELTALEELLRNIKYSDIVTAEKALAQLDKWIAVVKQPVTVAERAGFLLERITSGWATQSPENQKSVIDSLRGLVDGIKTDIEMGKEIDKALMDNITNILNSVSYGNFAEQYKDLAAGWLKDLAAPAAPVASEIPQDYPGRLNRIFVMAATNMEGFVKPENLTELTYLINNRAMAGPEMDKLKAVVEFVRWSDKWTDEQRDTINGMVAKVAGEITYPERISLLSGQVAAAAESEEAKEAFMADLQELVDEMVKNKKEGKEVAGITQIQSLLSYLKVSFADKSAQIDLMTKALNSAAPVPESAPAVAPAPAPEPEVRRRGGRGGRGSARR